MPFPEEFLCLIAVISIGAGGGFDDAGGGGGGAGLLLTEIGRGGGDGAGVFLFGIAAKEAEDDGVEGEIGGGGVDG